MTERTQIERAPVSEWIAQSLRATPFPRADAEVTPDGWWQHVLGEAPESQTIRPREGERREEGTFLGARLTLNVQPDRIDWKLSPTISGVEDLEGFPAVGSFQNICPEFRNLMHRWFTVSPPLERLALGAAVFLPVRDRIEGYKQLAEYLPAVKLDVEGSSDFLYRINRPRMSRSSVANLRINRLSTWAISRAQSQILRISRSAQRSGVISGEPVFMCKVELDINTSPEFEGILDGQQSAEVFDEMLDLAHEILGEGDRP